MSLKNNAILASASSKRVEIDVEELESLSVMRDQIKIGTLYELVNGNRVLLLANGFPVNFFQSSSVPDKIIDVILTLMFSGAISLAKGEMYLFSFALNFKNDLETKSLSKALKKILFDNECPLSDDVNIITLDDSKWEIYDEKNRYVIKEYDGWLNVYEEPKLKIYRCSANEYEIAELFHNIHF